MKKNTKLVALLTNLKNSLAPETKDDVKKAFDEAIAEAEAATTEVSAEDLVKLVEEKMAATMATKADVATLANMLQEKVIVNKAQDYLKSKKALTAFYNTIKNSTRDTFRKNWAEVLKKEISNDIDPNGALLPVEIVQSIVDRIQKAGSLFGMLNHTGLKAIRVPVNAMAEDSDTSRAGRHTKGQDKAAQVWDLSPKTILAQAIFKLLPVDYETMRQVDNESMLVAYITNELTNAWINEVERAILVGDGRSTSDVRHISSLKN
jgi:HK97 family phage major capsid protein